MLVTRKDSLSSPTPPDFACWHTADSTVQLIRSAYSFLPHNDAHKIALKKICLPDAQDGAGMNILPLLTRARH